MARMILRVRNLALSFALRKGDLGLWSPFPMMGSSSLLDPFTVYISNTEAFFLCFILFVTFPCWLDAHQRLHYASIAISPIG